MSKKIHRIFLVIFSPALPEISAGPNYYFTGNWVPQKFREGQVKNDQEDAVDF